MGEEHPTMVNQRMTAGSQDAGQTQQPDIYSNQGASSGEVATEMGNQNDEQDSQGAGAQIVEMPGEVNQVADRADLQEQDPASVRRDPNEEDKDVNLAFEETNTAPTFKRTTRQRARNLVRRFFGLQNDQRNAYRKRPYGS